MTASRWKAAARMGLHKLGGLAVLGHLNRRKFRVLAFHSFSEANKANVEAMCAHIANHFEVLSLSQMVDAIRQGKELPANAVAITVDDGYKNYALFGHPVFQRHKIPTTIYAVAGFAAGRLWLWPDQIEFGLQHTAKTSLEARLGSNGSVQLKLSSQEERAAAISTLTETLKVVPNAQRLTFMDGFEQLCGVTIPTVPPSERAALNWDELRALSAAGVEIGCHTETHPILTRLQSAIELEREIKGAKEILEQGLGRPVRHFCYPNGKAADLDDNVVACVREAGFDSAVTCIWGLNSGNADPLRLQRLPFDSRLEFGYAVELLAGLHL